MTVQKTEAIIAYPFLPTAASTDKIRHHPSETYLCLKNVIMSNHRVRDAAHAQHYENTPIQIY